MENCRQVNIPTVDNTNQECEILLSSKCVVIDYDSTIFRTMNNHPSLYDFISNMESVIKDLRRTNKLLKINNDNLVERIEALEAQVTPTP